MSNKSCSDFKALKKLRYVNYKIPAFALVAFHTGFKFIVQSTFRHSYLRPGALKFGDQMTDKRSILQKSRLSYNYLKY